MWVPLPQRFQPIHCVIYTGDTCSSEEILETTKVLASFFTIHNRRESCTSTSSLLSISNSCVSPSEPGWRPSTTPISRCFSSPWRPCSKLFTSARILSYTHYPTISTDMLHRVIHRETQFNNDAFITSHPLLSLLKQLYNTPTHQNHHPATIAYSPYSTPLRAAAPISSSQTAPGRTITSFRFGASHTVKIVGSHHSELSIVYPPCDTTEHRSLSAQSTPNTTKNNANSTNSSASSLMLPLRQRVILSVGQFRPEKNHVQQLYILRRLIDLGIPAGILPSR